MIRFKYYTKIFLFIVASSIFFSCNESDIGIFYGIETEEKLIDNSLANDITIGSMAKLGKNIYIGTGRVYTKDYSNNEDWRKLSTPSGYNLSTSIASNNAAIFAAFYNIDATKKGLFKLVGDNWTQVSSAFPNPVEMVKSANDVLFVSTRSTPNDGHLYYSTDGINFTEILIGELKGPDFHVIYNGTTYWIANWNNIYAGSNLSNIAHRESIDIERKITSLTPGFNDTYIYFSVWRKDDTSDKGYLYAIDNSNNISEKGDDPILRVINGIKCFSVTSSDNKIYYFILAATDGRGYYYHEFGETKPVFGTDIELERPRNNNILARNYTSATDMHYSVGLNFFMSDDPPPSENVVNGGDLYFMTVTSGLWKNSESGGSRNWSIE